MATSADRGLGAAETRLSPPSGGGTAWAPRLPPGRTVDLPGRGITFIRELPGPSADAPVVLLLHGWTASADLNWFPTYEPLAKAARVVAIDHRGHGRGIRSRDRFRLADCADDAAAVAEFLGLERIIAVGYSMGGPIAMLMWRRHRHLVDGLVLCATAPVFSRSSGWPRVVRGSFPVMAQIGRVTPPQLRQVVARAILGRRLEDNSVGAWMRSEIARGDPVAIAEAGAAIGRFNNHDWLGDIDVPTAVVQTTKDAVVSLVRQRRLLEMIPGAVGFEVPSDHDGCVSEAGRFVPTLVRAVKSVADRTGAA